MGVLRVDTENSIWFVTSERYQRLPREERPRPEVRSIEHRLADGEWHRLRRAGGASATTACAGYESFPRLVSADGHGIVTGVVVAVTGGWLLANGDARIQHAAGFIRD